MWAQQEHEDWEMEQLVQEVQMCAEEERRREEQRRIGEKKQIVEEAEWQWRLAELQRVVKEVQEDDDEEDDRQGAGPSAPKKRKYEDKVSNNGNYMKN